MPLSTQHMPMILQVGVDFTRGTKDAEGKPTAIAAAARDEAVRGGYDAVLVDTAGRLQV